MLRLFCWPGLWKPPQQDDCMLCFALKIWTQKYLQQHPDKPACWFQLLWMLAIVVKQLRMQKTAAQLVGLFCLLIMNIIPKGKQWELVIKPVWFPRVHVHWLHCVNRAASRWNTVWSVSRSSSDKLSLNSSGDLSDLYLGTLSRLAPVWRQLNQLMKSNLPKHTHVYYN